MFESYTYNTYHNSYTSQLKQDHCLCKMADENGEKKPLLGKLCVHVSVLCIYMCLHY